MRFSAAPLRQAAVLVPVYRNAAGELQLVLVRRGDFGIHGGQLAFPGGKPEPTDASLVDTALRETWEETGLPTTDVQILDTLPTIPTYASNFLITPFLGRIVPPVTWLPMEHEIAEVLEVSVRHLADPSTQQEGEFWSPNRDASARFPFFQVGDHRLWGATYLIVQPLLPRLLAGEWDV
ncbi:CoA pyrophosphatase [Hymenobacter sp. GOD-10R]|uniref:NUDIX hydrolase n=1 Tax=Hymenobacter sp. GOD-10R TaxID=3093922 RepID=UPI002D79AF3A|nr:CoA pyrophosphatase [Hymenobacter sp. GOD-10R]WRQ29732.1 CoA pyrophosphatase [Hymenobacter sp. GOD-10R]